MFSGYDKKYRINLNHPSILHIERQSSELNRGVVSLRLTFKSSTGLVKDCFIYDGAVEGVVFGIKRCWYRPEGFVHAVHGPHHEDFRMEVPVHLLVPVRKVRVNTRRGKTC